MRTPRIKHKTLLKDLLYNAHTENLSDDKNLSYARGVVVGVVGTIMAMTNLTFAKALRLVKKIDPNIDPRSLPESWRNEWENVQ